jgi:monofunctional glycosyltransferase
MRHVPTFLLALAVLAVGGLLWLDAPSRGPVPPPEQLSRRNPSTTTLILLRRAEARRKGKPLVLIQRWAPLSGISRPMQKSVLAAEDSGFYGHHGVEWELVLEAAKDNWKAGKPVRGASTITQQLAKNLYLTPRKTYLRKVRELLYTWRLERALSKRRIFELYLNVVEWGNGVFGAEAAAQVTFGKSAAELNWDESIALAAAIPSPRRHPPEDGSRWTAQRKEWVRQQLWTAFKETAGR